MTQLDDTSILEVSSAPSITGQNQSTPEPSVVLLVRRNNVDFELCFTAAELRQMADECEAEMGIGDYWVKNVR